MMMTDFKVNVDIKSYVAERKMKLKDFFANNDRPLWIIQVGNNEASNRYIRNKIKDCKEVGLTNVEWSVFKETISQEELIKEIKDSAVAPVDEIKTEAIEILDKVKHDILKEKLKLDLEEK